MTIDWTLRGSLNHCGNAHGVSVHGRGAVEAWSFDALGMTTVTYDDG
ncbi:MAG: hypothetical protein IPN69_10395 [Acidobacteria bacterium]|nr:hypothetical protein [Acidobacteriota bacterium]